MSGVETRAVAARDADMRLDRWFKQHYPELGFRRLQKLLRTGQVRVDGKRAKPGQRLEPGQEIRVPPLDGGGARPRTPAEPDAADATFVQSLVLFHDDDLIAIDKPAGLAVQGGTRTERHLDGLLDCLRFDADERPRLVHRLDKDTSGVMVLARHRAAAAALGRAFKARSARKLYWAVTVGVPAPEQRTIKLALSKGGGPGRERAFVDPKHGKRAESLFKVLEKAGDKVAWVVLWPRTGRTHQLRVHMAQLGRPILGDGKYGGKAAFVEGRDLDRQLHLHARELVLTHPRTGKDFRFVAPPPPHMLRTFDLYGFDPADGLVDPFPHDL